MQKCDVQLMTGCGGGGVVGRYVGQKRLAGGAGGRVAQREPRQATCLKPLGGLGQMQFVAVDVREATGVARAVQGSDAVVNLVGSFDDMEAVHAKGAANIAAAARQAGVHALVHVSAIGADTASPSAYGRSKGGGEAAVRAAFPTAALL